MMKNQSFYLIPILRQHISYKIFYTNLSVCYSAAKNLYLNEKNFSDKK